MAAALRSAIGSHTDHPAVAELVDELSAGSARFRQVWGRHDVRSRTNGVMMFDHPGVGLLELSYEKMAVLSAPGPWPGSAGQHLVTFQAEPGSASALRLASPR